MNLGALYANQNQLDKAEKAFRDAITATKGPLFEKLDAEGQAAWLRFRDMANLNVAQMAGARGVEHFETKEFDKAATEFLAATQINPHARDYWFNVAQAYWAQSTGIETKLDSMPAAEQATAKQELIRLYEQVVKYAQKTRELDPNSEMLFLIEAQSERRMGEAQSVPERLKQGQDKALALLEAAEALPVVVSDVIVQASDGTATIAGKLRGKKLAAGAPVTLHFTLVGIDGKVLAEHDVAVTVGAADTDAEFQAEVASVPGEVAGWKYVVKS
jgi:tetratricopeptide (TPR) repeat protein